MSTLAKRTYTTLLDYYGIGKSERWDMPQTLSIGDIIKINDVRKRVVAVEYIFSTSDNKGTICNIFIHTEFL